MNISGERLVRQRIALDSHRHTPDAVVRWLLAVQAQDYYGSLWAVGLRARGSIEPDIEEALANGSIVRTWPMRGTLHLVAAEDVRWLLALLAPRIARRHARRLERDYGIDASVVGHSADVLRAALRDRGPVARSAVYQALDSAGIRTTGQRGLHILWRLAHDALICCGPREGRQPTFVLLDEWVPRHVDSSPVEPLAELTRRYFESHGPATVQDFVWWSGLSTADARRGIDACASELLSTTIDSRTYWTGRASVRGPAAREAVLLPAYDEYTVGYADRSPVLSVDHAARADARSGILNPTISIDGQIAGTWKRTKRSGSVTIALNLFRPLNKTEQRAVAAAGDRYGEFLRVAVRTAG